MVKEADGGRRPGFERRKAQVLATAKQVFNERGMRGFSLASVASALEVRPASLAHYFRRKDQLVTACLLDTVRQYVELLDAVQAQGSPGARLRAFLAGYFELQRQVRLGAESAPISVSEIRLMTSSMEPLVADGLRDVVRRLATLFEDPQKPWLTVVRTRLIARLVIECVDWSSAWLDLYDVDEYAEVAKRLAGVLEQGFVPEDTQMAERTPFALGSEAISQAPTSRESFLMAATELINQRGYHSVSVDEIAAALKLTKGAFYHHNTDKEDLLLACCSRTLDVMREALCRSEPGLPPVVRLVDATLALAAHQADGRRGRLLRLYVLSELPPDQRQRVLLEYKLVALRFAAMISAGIADGSVKPMDPFLGAMVLIAMCNSAAYFEPAAGRGSADLALGAYTRQCLVGVFNR